jgi:hypothetical protein
MLGGTAWFLEPAAFSLRLLVSNPAADLPIAFILLKEKRKKRKATSSPRFSRWKDYRE